MFYGLHDGYGPFSLRRLSDDAGILGPARCWTHYTTSRTRNALGTGTIRDEEMRHDSPGLDLDDTMNGYSSVQGWYKNMNLASRMHSWDIAVGADTGCRQKKQGAAFAGLGLEAGENWSREGVSH